MLLNALMRTPVGVVRQVGFVLMLLVSILEANLPADGAPPPASTTGRAAGAVARGNAVAANEDRERAVKIVAFAKAKKARGNRFMGEGGKTVAKGTQNVKVQTLRRWAVKRNQKLKQLLQLLHATTAIGADDALLLQYHAGGIELREAGKVKNVPAARENREVFSSDKPPHHCAHMVPIISLSERAEYKHQRTIKELATRLSCIHGNATVSDLWGARSLD